MFSDVETSETSLKSSHSVHGPSHDISVLSMILDGVDTRTTMLRPIRFPPGPRSISTGSGYRMGSRHSMASSMCLSSPPPSRSSSVVSAELTDIDVDSINALYDKRAEIKTALERLVLDLLKLLHEEWTVSGIVPAEYERQDIRLCRTSQRLKSTSFPMRQLIVNRANTFSHPQISTRGPEQSPLLNTVPIDRLTDSSTKPWSYQPPCLNQGNMTTDFPRPETDLSSETRLPRSCTSSSTNISPDTREIDPNPCALLESASVVSQAIKPEEHHSTNQPFPKELDLIDDIAEVEQAMIHLKIRRLEVDYAVVSRLREIHKQKAAETKRDAYRLAYKTNARKLKEIMAEMTRLKAQLSCPNSHPHDVRTEVLKRRIRECNPRKSLKFFSSKKHTSLVTLPRHGSDANLSNQQFSVSTPTTPGKPKNAHSNDLSLPGFTSSPSVPVSISQASKSTQRPRRTSLLPRPGIFHTHKRSIKVSTINVAKLINLDESSMNSPKPIETKPSHTKRSKSNRLPDPSISWTNVDRVLSFNQTSMNKTREGLNSISSNRLPPVPNRPNDRSQSETLSSPQHSTLSQNIASTSLFEPDLDPAFIHGGSEIKEYIDRPSTEPENHIRNQTTNPSFASMPKQTSTTSSNVSSSNWSTSGCSSMASNTSALLSPEASRHATFLRRASSAPVLKIPHHSPYLKFNRDSNSKRITTSKRHTCPTEHISCKDGKHLHHFKRFLHSGLADSAHQSRSNFHFVNADIVPTNSPKHLDEDDDEGYEHCSDGEFIVDHTTPDLNASNTQCDVTLVEYGPESDHIQASKTGERVRRSSLRPLMMLRRAFSRMSSRGPDRSMSTPVTATRKTSRHR